MSDTSKCPRCGKFWFTNHICESLKKELLKDGEAMMSENEMTCMSCGGTAFKYKKEKVENDEINTTKEKVLLAYNSTADYPEGIAVKDMLKILFPEAFEPQERKLELTEENIGTIWKIVWYGKSGIELEGHVYWVRQEEDLTIVILRLNDPKVSFYSNIYNFGTIKFLAPSLQEYLDKGGRIY